MNWLEVSPGRRRLPPARPPARSVSGSAPASSGSLSRALGAQRVQQQGERAAPQLRRRVEAVRAATCGGGREQEPRGRPGLGAEDVGLGRRERAAGAVHDDLGAPSLDGHAEAAQAGGERVRVAGLERPAQHRAAGREPGQQQRAVGHALGAGHAHDGVEARSGRADGARAVGRGASWPRMIPQRPPGPATGLLRQSVDHVLGQHERSGRAGACSRTPAWGRRRSRSAPGPRRGRPPPGCSARCRRSRRRRGSRSSCPRRAARARRWTDRRAWVADGSGAALVGAGAADDAAAAGADESPEPQATTAVARTTASARARITRTMRNMRTPFPLRFAAGGAGTGSRYLTHAALRPLLPTSSRRPRTRSRPGSRPPTASSAKAGMPPAPFSTTLRTSAASVPATSALPWWQPLHWALQIAAPSAAEPAAGALVAGAVVAVPVVSVELSPQATRTAPRTTASVARMIRRRMRAPFVGCGWRCLPGAAAAVNRRGAWSTARRPRRPACRRARTAAAGASRPRRPRRGRRAPARAP